VGETSEAEFVGEASQCGWVFVRVEEYSDGERSSPAAGKRRKMPLGQWWRFMAHDLWEQLAQAM